MSNETKETKDEKPTGETIVRRVIDNSSPFYLNSGDNPGMMISSCVLKDNNYDMWVKAMRNALRAKNKLGFIDGTVMEPKIGDLEYGLWGTCNSMMVSWVFNSIDPSLQPSVAYYETIKEMWDDLRERFSVGNAPRIHQLKSEIAAAKQHGQPVVIYYTHLKGMWDELSHHSPVPSCVCQGCTCHVTAKLMKEREEEKIHQFLMGLDDSVFGNVRTHILGMDPLPSLSKVYSMVVQEERHRSVVRGRDDKQEAVGFSVRINKPEVTQQKGGSNEKVVCTHCSKPGHDVTRCFEIIGYPEGWGRGGRGVCGGRGGRSRGRGRAYAHAVHGNNVTESQGFASDVSQQKIPGLNEVQMKQIMAILNSSNGSSASGADEKLQGKFSNRNWLLDSGASHHMTGDIDCLQNVYPVNTTVVTLPNGEQTMAEQEGMVELVGGVVLKRVLYVPCLSCSLISLSKLIKDNGCFVTFTDELCVVQDLISKMPIGVGEMRDGIYYYHSIASARASLVRKSEDYLKWHRRMGHPSTQTTLLFPGVRNDGCDSNKICDICLQAKQTRDVFPVSFNKAIESFELIHCDIWGPYRVASHCGAHYFLTVVDDFSRAVWVYLMTEKKETSKLLISFCKMVKNQFGKCVKCVRTDNGLEFKTGVIKEFYAEHGILHQSSCVYTPQQNGRVERKHRHILNVARALRFQAHLPIEFWGECILTAAYLINRTPTRILENKTPYELLFEKTPSYEHVRVFGCLCHVSHRTTVSDKFESRSRKCVFVGYPFGKKGWRVYDMETGNFIVSRDVIFDEDIFPFAEIDKAKATDSVSGNVIKELSGVNEEHVAELSVEENDELIARGSSGANDVVTEHQPNDMHEDFEEISMQHEERTQQSEIIEEINENSGAQSFVPLHEQRVRRPPNHLKDYICYTARVEPYNGEAEIKGRSSTVYPIDKYVTCDKFSRAHKVFLAAVTKEKEPAHFGEAMKDKNWCEAMKTEIDALERNATWTLEDLPPNKVAIGCKWVYRIKYHADGQVERYKARLVALGNRQVHGVDFTETFAPVAKMVSVRTFLAVAAARKWELHQMDVHNAFLHGDLNEEVYMCLPPGFAHSHPGKVCRLRKSIYGLRQAPRMWFSKLTSALEAYGFIQSKADYSLFTCHKGTAFIAILIYVDDLVVAGNDSSAIHDFKKYMSEVFHMKDLGVLKYFLGIEIARGPTGLFLSQRKYALDMLAECGLLGAKPAATPLEQNHRLAESMSAKLKDPEKYRRLVGRLIYLTITRPELSYSVHTLAQFMHDPLEDHYAAVLRVVRYLKGNPGQGVLLRADSELQLNGYCDSDWASCPTTRRSLTGYFVLLGGSPISWKTKKQPTVSRSSAEAEYRSMANATCELLWLKSLLRSLGITHAMPMNLHCDSQAALHIATNPVFHERTKHIELDCHFVRDQIKTGCVVTKYVRSSEQLADIFTKSIYPATILTLKFRHTTTTPESPSDQLSLVLLGIIARFDSSHLQSMLQKWSDHTGSTTWKTSFQEQNDGQDEEDNSFSNLPFLLWNDSKFGSCADAAIVGLMPPPLLELQSSQRYYCSVTIGEDSVISAYRLSEDRSRSLVGAILSRVGTATISTISSFSSIIWRREPSPTQKARPKPQSFAEDSIAFDMCERSTTKRGETNSFSQWYISCCY
ncbi:Retroelement pol polyprotein-like [Rhynchospora pubera]|uniref:Retroelement pol polyprotein-like n=1 Tax=Rhynchospora pubera TaxID=906938 RepID=A0AAV8DRD4_9POAL|nr:Retroelement pol polyprotein-like [Rhynchospora pubera]